MAMAFKKIDIYETMRKTILVLLTFPLVASANIDCGGKAFHCVNSTHFMICVDLGGGVSSTIDDFIIPCPPSTVCQKTNYYECEFPSWTTTVSIIDKSVPSGLGPSEVSSLWDERTVSTPPGFASDVKFSETSTVSIPTLPEESVTIRNDLLDVESITSGHVGLTTELITHGNYLNGVNTEATTLLSTDANTDSTTIEYIATTETIITETNDFLSPELTTEISPEKTTIYNYTTQKENEVMRNIFDTMFNETYTPTEAIFTNNVPMYEPSTTEIINDLDLRSTTEYLTHVFEDTHSYPQFKETSEPHVTTESVIPILEQQTTNKDQIPSDGTTYDTTETQGLITTENPSSKSKKVSSASESGFFGTSFETITSTSFSIITQDGVITTEGSPTSTIEQKRKDSFPTTNPSQATTDLTYETQTTSAALSTLPEDAIVTPTEPTMNIVNIPEINSQDTLAPNDHISTTLYFDIVTEGKPFSVFEETYLNINNSSSPANVATSESQVTVQTLASNLETATKGSVPFQVDVDMSMSSSQPVTDEHSDIMTTFSSTIEELPSSDMQITTISSNIPENISQIRTNSHSDIQTSAFNLGTSTRATVSPQNDVPIPLQSVTEKNEEIITTSSSIIEELPFSDTEGATISSRIPHTTRQVITESHLQVQTSTSNLESVSQVTVLPRVDVISVDVNMPTSSSQAITDEIITTTFSTIEEPTLFNIEETTIGGGIYDIASQIVSESNFNVQIPTSNATHGSSQMDAPVVDASNSISSYQAVTDKKNKIATTPSSSTVEELLSVTQETTTSTSTSNNTRQVISESQFEVQTSTSNSETATQITVPHQIDVIIPIPSIQAATDKNDEIITTTSSTIEGLLLSEIQGTTISSSISETATVSESQFDVQTSKSNVDTQGTGFSKADGIISTEASVIEGLLFSDIQTTTISSSIPDTARKVISESYFEDKTSTSNLETATQVTVPSENDVIISIPSVQVLTDKNDVIMTTTSSSTIEGPLSGIQATTIISKIFDSASHAVSESQFNIQTSTSNIETATQDTWPSQINVTAVDVDISISLSQLVTDKNYEIATTSINQELPLMNIEKGTTISNVPATANLLTLESEIQTTTSNTETVTMSTSQTNYEMMTTTSSSMNKESPMSEIGRKTTSSNVLAGSSQVTLESKFQTTKSNIETDIQGTIPTQIDVTAVGDIIPLSFSKAVTEHNYEIKTIASPLVKKEPILSNVDKATTSRSIPVPASQPAVSQVAQALEIQATSSGLEFVIEDKLNSQRINTIHVEKNNNENVIVKSSTITEGDPFILSDIGRKTTSNSVPAIASLENKVQTTMSNIETVTQRTLSSKVNVTSMDVNVPITSSQMAKEKNDERTITYFSISERSTPLVIGTATTSSSMHVVNQETIQSNDFVQTSMSNIEVATQGRLPSPVDVNIPISSQAVKEEDDKVLTNVSASLISGSPLSNVGNTTIRVPVVAGQSTMESNFKIQASTSPSQTAAGSVPSQVNVILDDVNIPISSSQYVTEKENEIMSTASYLTIPERPPVSDAAKLNLNYDVQSNTPTEKTTSERASISKSIPVITSRLISDADYTIQTTASTSEDLPMRFIKPTSVSGAILPIQTKHGGVTKLPITNEHNGVQNIDDKYMTEASSAFYHQSDVTKSWKVITSNQYNYVSSNNTALLNQHNKITSSKINIDDNMMLEPGNAQTTYNSSTIEKTLTGDQLNSETILKATNINSNIDTSIQRPVEKQKNNSSPYIEASVANDVYKSVSDKNNSQINIVNYAITDINNVPNRSTVKYSTLTTNTNNKDDTSTGISYKKERSNMNTVPIKYYLSSTESSIMDNKNFQSKTQLTESVPNLKTISASDPEDRTDSEIKYAAITSFQKRPTDEIVTKVPHSEIEQSQLASLRKTKFDNDEVATTLRYVTPSPGISTTKNTQTTVNAYFGQHSKHNLTMDSTTRFPETEFKVQNPLLSYCHNRSRGRYSDHDDCTKFYICIGRNEPIVGKCPADTVFSELNKQCTKNKAHCIRNNEFKCLSQGRFSDILKQNVYYICVKHRNTFIRFEFQCQNGYNLDKTAVKCTKEEILHQSTSNDKTKSETSSSEVKNNKETKQSKAEKKDKEKSKEEFECQKEGKFMDPNSCKKYYVCTKNKKSEFRRRRKSCDSDELFHKDKKKCVDADSYEC